MKSVKRLTGEELRKFCPNRCRILTVVEVVDPVEVGGAVDGGTIVDGLHFFC